MPRKVKIRTSYAADAAYLSRLLEAVEKDDKRTPAWKKRAIVHIQGLIGVMIEPLANEQA